MSGSQRSLAKGSPAPGLVPEGLIRLYSMRFCPYAQRARLVLAAKGIKHEVVNINLKSKPEWFFEKNPLGMVPCLETPDGKLIYESVIVCDYLDEVYPGKKLTPEDPYEKAQQKILLERFSTASSALYKIVFAKKDNQDTTEAETQLFEKFKAIEEALAKKDASYFGGKSVSMVDYMMWPLFERFPLFDLELLEKTPLIKAWYNLMLQDPAVKETHTELEVLITFYKLYSENSVDAADVGLD